MAPRPHIQSHSQSGGLARSLQQAQRRAGRGAPRPAPSPSLTPPPRGSAFRPPAPRAPPHHSPRPGLCGTTRVFQPLASWAGRHGLFRSCFLNFLPSSSNPAPGPNNRFINAVFVIVCRTCAYKRGSNGSNLPDIGFCVDFKNLLVLPRVMSTRVPVGPTVYPRTWCSQHSIYCLENWGPKCNRAEMNQPNFIPSQS